MLQSYSRFQRAKNGQTFENSTVYRMWNLLEAFGGYYLHEMTKVVIDDYVTERLELVSQSTVKREINDLKAFLNQAIEQEKLQSVPIFMKLGSSPVLARWLTIQEEGRLLDVVENRVKQALIIALDTSVRKSELFGLKWEYINLEKRFLILPKTKNSHSRHLKLTRRVIDVLNGMDPKKSGFVFVHDKGRHKGKRNLELRRVFHTLLNEFGIENFRFHDLRHTFASRLVQYGILYIA